MGLADIAAGIEVTERQRETGVAAVDETATPLAERLDRFADALPCRPADAATVVEAYAEGKSVGACGHAAGVAPVTAAKTLHLVGEQVSPLGPTARDVVQDWLAGDLSRSDALALTGVGEDEFALAAFCASHDPLPAAREAVEGALESDVGDDGLGETHSDVDDLL